MASQQQREVKLAFIRSTPGTHVFATAPRARTAEPAEVCKQVYLSREAMPTPPKEITLTVAWEA